MKNGMSFTKEKRDRKIMICLTNSEYEKLEKLAYNSVLSISSYCRQILVENIRKVEEKND